MLRVEQYGSSRLVRRLLLYLSKDLYLHSRVSTRLSLWCRVVRLDINGSESTETRLECLEGHELEKL